MTQTAPLWSSELSKAKSVVSNIPSKASEKELVSSFYLKFAANLR